MTSTSLVVFSLVCVCFPQSPTAQQCGWWCLWCACRSWLSLFSSSSSSAPWDTTAACRAPRVRHRVDRAPARQSTRRQCSFLGVITDLSVLHLWKAGGGWFEAQIMPRLFWLARKSKQSPRTHEAAYLCLMEQKVTVWWRLMPVQYVSVCHLLQPTHPSANKPIWFNHWEIVFITL